jgi:hypothetical protein
VDGLGWPEAPEKRNANLGYQPFPKQRQIVEGLTEFAYREFSVENEFDPSHEERKWPLGVLSIDRADIAHRPLWFDQRVGNHPVHQSGDQCDDLIGQARRQQRAISCTTLPTSPGHRLHDSE